MNFRALNWSAVPRGQLQGRQVIATSSGVSTNPQTLKCFNSAVRLKAVQQHVQSCDSKMLRRLRCLPFWSCAATRGFCLSLHNWYGTSLSSLGSLPGWLGPEYEYRFRTAPTHSHLKRRRSWWWRPCVEICSPRTDDRTPPSNCSVLCRTWHHPHAGLWAIRVLLYLRLCFHWRSNTLIQCRRSSRWTAQCTRMPPPASHSFKRRPSYRFGSWRWSRLLYLLLSR